MQTKTPIFGEWWRSNDNTENAFICGFDHEGDPVVRRSSDLYDYEMSVFLKHWHHEPRCDSFGWIDPNDNSTLSVRCRRKNLPVAVPSIKRVPVRLWINEEDGWLFASPDQVLASDQEILHDADGFFVESPAIDPNDMPLNPVPGKVVATGTKTPQPVESPDDWVEITDSHPGHIRRLCDQVCDKYARESIHNWHYVGCTVGHSQHAYPMSRIRCRRKNLPVAVPATSETITADTDNMAAIIAEHTQQVRELTQRIGELVQQVNERDAVIEKILPHCRPDCSV